MITFVEIAQGGEILGDDVVVQAADADDAAKLSIIAGCICAFVHSPGGGSVLAQPRRRLSPLHSSCTSVARA